MIPVDDAVCATAVGPPWTVLAQEVEYYDRQEKRRSARSDGSLLADGTDKHIWGKLILYILSGKCWVLYTDENYTYPPVVYMIILCQRRLISFRDDQVLLPRRQEYGTVLAE